MDRRERRKLADALGEAEATLQATERYHDRQGTELSRLVWMEARRQLKLVQTRVERVLAV